MSEKSKGFGLGGVVIGIILIPVAFYINYSAALRTQGSEVLEGATPVAQRVAGKPFFATGPIQPRKIGDKDYFKEDEKVPVLELERKVEVYAWYGEKKQTDTTKTEEKKKKKKYNNKKKKKKKKGAKYKCKKGWIEKPKNDKEFRKGCAGKPFKAKKIESRKKKVAHITVKDAASGKSYSVQGGVDIAIDRAELTAAQIAPYLKDDSGLIKKGENFYDKASCGEPVDTKKIGCHRVKWLGIMVDKNDQYTVIGGMLKRDPEVDRQQIGPFMASGKSFLKLCKGDVNACMGELAKRDRTMTYVLLGGSMLAFFIGLMLMTGPLTNLLERVPVIGGFGSGILKFIFLVFSVVLMFLFFILFKFWYIVIGAFVVLIILLFVLKKKG